MRRQGPLTLAYMGDAVFELLTRERIVLAGEKPPAELNRLARGYVTAVAQSAAVERLLPLLDEDETAVYKRGRNCQKRACAEKRRRVEYRRATGLSACSAISTLPAGLNAHARCSRRSARPSL